MQNKGYSGQSAETACTLGESTAICTSATRSISNYLKISTINNKKHFKCTLMNPLMND
jgi:hypothetical protein